MKLSSGLTVDPRAVGKEEGVWQRPERQKAKGRQASALDKGSGRDQWTTTARRMTDRAETDGGGNNWKIEEPILRSAPHYPVLYGYLSLPVEESRSPGPGVRDPAPKTDRAGLRSTQ